MLEITDHGPVREIRLARPPVNALSPELLAALLSAVQAAPREGAKALVLSGPPGRFSAGLDVPLLLTLDRSALTALWERLYGLMRSLAGSPIPVVAAITGHSPAGGAVMAIFCDRRVMAEGPFVIGLNEVPVGLALPPVIARRLAQLVGHRTAVRLATEGQLLPSAEACAVGLVDALAPPEQVVPAAIAWCESVLALPSHAYRATRELFQREVLAVFDQNPAELAGVTEMWFSAETQAALKQLVARLQQKKG
ncbi:MAG: enoyl-CoA hydratase/isomerase family protein [Thermoanaerobaculia bacterium]